MRSGVARHGRDTGHLASVIDDVCNITDRQQIRVSRSPQIAEVMRRAILVPEHGVQPGPEGRDYGVRTGTRRTDGLAVVVDSERHSHRVARERMKFPYLALSRSPNHSFKIENLGSSAIDSRPGWAPWVADAILRIPRSFAMFVDLTG